MAKTRAQRKAERRAQEDELRVEFLGHLRGHLDSLGGGGGAICANGDC